MNRAERPVTGNRMRAAGHRRAGLLAGALGTALVLALAGAPAAAQQPVPDPPKTVPTPAPTPTAKPAQTAPPVAPPAAAPAPAAGTQPTENAADPGLARVAACKDRALARLKEQSPSIDDIFIDVDGLTIAEANGKLGDTAVKGVIMGEAYIRRDRSDRVNRFLCLTGQDDAVLFTFFTER